MTLATLDHSKLISTFRMEDLTSVEIDLSKLLRWSTVVGIFLAVLISKLRYDTQTKSPIPHAPCVPYRLPLGKHDDVFSVIVAVVETE